MKNSCAQTACRLDASRPPKWWALVAILTSTLLFSYGCNRPDQSPDERDVDPAVETGTLNAALSLPSEELGVESVLFVVRGEDGEEQSEVVALEEHGLPSAVDEELAGHPFADWLVVLSPGPYEIEAVPLDENGDPSRVCSPASGEAEVVSEATVEVLLVSDCDVEGSGALDVAVAFNRPPALTELESLEGKFACTDEAFSATLTGVDPDGDDLVWTWSVVGVPDGVTSDDYCLTADEGDVAFASTTEGKFELQVELSDGRVSTQLTFPVYLSECGAAPACPGDLALGGATTPPDTALGRCFCEGQPPVVVVSDEVQPVVPSLPGDDGPRPLARYANEDGDSVDFVSNELVIMTDDEAELSDFLARHGGEVVGTTDLGRLGVDDVPVVHRVRLDPSGADTSSLADNWSTSAGATGTQTLSSTEGQALMAIALSEAVERGTKVSLNFVMEPEGFSERFTEEQETSPGVHLDAFDLPYMNRGSAQDIGTAEAWRVLEAMGRFDNRVRIAVADGGFIPNADFPDAQTIIGGARVPNPDPTSCGSDTSTVNCTWHGTQVVMAGMAKADNELGAAGPAGPIADVVMLQSPNVDFFAILEFIAIQIPVAVLNRPRIVNISASVDVPAEVCLAALIGFPICEIANEISRGFRRAGMLVVAAAGNDGKDVDETKLFGPCPFCIREEKEIVIPCELNSVICVGGLQNDSRARDDDSNWGSSPGDGGSVDIYGPFEVLSVADPTLADIANSSPDLSLGPVFGTSFASPYVAGVAALVWAGDPSLTASEVENILYGTAHTSSPDAEVRRRVNALGAVQQAVGGDTPPFVEITSPSDGDTFSGAGFFTVTANAEDLEGTVDVDWFVNGRRVGSGESLSLPLSDLPFGTNTIEAEASDRTGNTSPRDSVTVTYENQRPIVFIESPRSFETYCHDQVVPLTGTLINAEGPLPDANFSWYIDDVFLSNGMNSTLPAFTFDPDPGVAHRVRLEVVDGAHGDADTDFLTIVDCTESPFRIIRPADGQRFTLGDSIPFEANWTVSAGSWEWEIIPNDTGVPIPKLCAPPPLPRDPYSCGDLNFFYPFLTDRDAVGSYTIRLTLFPSDGSGPIVEEITIHIDR